MSVLKREEEKIKIKKDRQTTTETDRHYFGALTPESRVGTLQGLTCQISLA